MTEKAKIIAGVVGGVLVVGGIGSTFNKDKDEERNSSDSSSISQSVSNEVSNLENSEDSSKIYTVDEFCTRFENEDNFAHDHKDQIFTVNGTVDDKVFGTLYFKSSVESEKWHSDYKITCKFKDRELIEDIEEGADASISGKLYSFATSGIVLQDCTVVAFENPNNSFSSEVSSESTSEQSSEPGQSSEPIESSSEQSSAPESSSESSSSTESEPQFTIREPESNSELPPVSSTSPELEQSSIATSSNDLLTQQISGYVFNTHTKKYHRPSCSDVKKINPENYATYIDASEFAQYSPCKRCKP